MRMGLFKKEEVKEKEVQRVVETKIEIKKDDVATFRKKNLSLFDVNTIQYVIENFPSMSIEIQNGLKNLSNILENTINHIEDKSSEIIKKDRDFKLSKAYRDTSIAIYDDVQSINEYFKWMEDEHDKNMKKCEIKGDLGNIKNEIKGTKVEEKSENIFSEIANAEQIEIYKDFSLKEPKAFKLGDEVIVVDDWNDLLVKTAEVLTKRYRKNRYSNKTVKEIKPVEKKSTQNSFRDTVIEMLLEYKISLDEFKIIIR
jgi:hypothetical protein